LSPAVLGTIAVLAVLAAAGFNTLAVTFSCSFDTSYCAASQTKDTAYLGEFPGIRSPTRFTVSFASLGPYSAVPFTTDGSGRFCFVWVNERIVPTATIQGRPFVAVQDRFDVQPGKPLRGCPITDESVPWNRTGDVGAAWQVWAIYAFGAFALITLAASLYPWGARKQTVRAAGLWASAATPVLCALLWLTAA
jgi:hypothetical protein